MKRYFSKSLLVGFTCLFGMCLGPVAHATTLLSLPFDEGAGIYVNDTAQNLIGTFGGVGADPAIDTVALTNDSPSGNLGDRSFVNNRGGFLMSDDSATSSLDITNGPITIEGWVKVNPNFRQPNEGIASYGNSYKLGLRNRILTFTLYGIQDIAIPLTNAFPVDEWVHVGASWYPGIGVDFYITQITNGTTVTSYGFKSYTALAARPVQHNFLSVGAEGLLGVTLAGGFDRVKIHNRYLLEEELDKDPLVPKANYPETVAAYNFDETDFPANNSVAGGVSLPLSWGNPVAAPFYAPVWTNDSPSGVSGDHAIAFNLDAPANKQRITLDFRADQINLGVNNTNYTLQAWVKLPTNDPIANRMVFLRTSGAAPRVSMSIHTDRKLWTTIGGNTDFKSNVIFPSDNAWHHVAVVVTNFAQVHFYLDGVLQQTMNRTSASIPSTLGVTNLLMGMEADATYFRGLLDRIRIDNTALSVEELDSVAVPLPRLSIESNGGSFVLTWPENFTGYILEGSDAIPASTWVEQPYTTENGQNTATITGSPQNRFYRLRK